VFEKYQTLNKFTFCSGIEVSIKAYYLSFVSSYDTHLWLEHVFWLLHFRIVCGIMGVIILFLVSHLPRTVDA